jgi:hypothetical protein
MLGGEVGPASALEKRPTGHLPHRGKDAAWEASMSLPAPDDPRIPYVHGRDLVPIRRQAQRGRNAWREQRYQEEDELRAAIEDVDRQLVELTERRRALLDELGQLHDEILPIWKRCAGRRRRAVSQEEPLPPTAPKPTWLWGRELRAVCLALLRAAQGALSLRQLHVLLHRAGYAIAHRAPGKALADALGHEADIGRARRVARGCYASTGRDETTEVPAPSALPDW